MTAIQGDIFNTLGRARDYNPSRFVSLEVAGERGLLFFNEKRMASIFASHIPTGMVTIGDNNQIVIGANATAEEISRFFIDVAQHYQPVDKHKGEKVLLAKQWADAARFDNSIAKYPRALRSVLGLPSHNIVCIGYRLKSEGEVEIISSVRPNNGVVFPKTLLDYTHGGGKDVEFTTHENHLIEALQENGPELHAYFTKNPDCISSIGVFYTTRQHLKKFLQAEIKLRCADLTNYNGPFVPDAESAKEIIGFKNNSLNELMRMLQNGEEKKLFKYDYPVALILFVDHLAQQGIITRPNWLSADAAQEFRALAAQKTAITGSASPNLLASRSNSGSARKTLACD